MANADQALREDLFAEIEAAWIGRRDATVVDRLAAQHPEYAEDLYEFFADLFFAERSDELPEEVEKELGASLERWFEEEGQQIAREAAEAARSTTPTTTPSVVPAAREADESAGPIPLPTGVQGARESARPYLTLVEDRTGLEVAEIAEKLGDDCTVELLLFTQRHPELYPWPVRREFASRTERMFGIPPEVVLLSFESKPKLRMAASRSKGYGAPPATWEDLLRRAGLTFQHQRFWANLAREA